MIDRTRRRETDADPVVLLLQALGWVCAEPERAGRLLDLTGLSGDELKARAMEPAVLNAIGDFLRAHEPDLIACARALTVAPEVLAGAQA